MQLRNRLGLTGLCGLLVVVAAVGPTSYAEEAKAPPVEMAQVTRWLAQVSNWGRWGPNDELGALNLITPAKRRQAAALVRAGDSVSLSRDLDKVQSPNNQTPFEQRLTVGQAGGAHFAFDRYGIEEHGWGISHIDAPSHMVHEGKLYNGYPASSLVPTRPGDRTTPSGATKLGVQLMANGILSRGILIDIPRLKGLPYLEPATAIMPADLDAWERSTGVRIGPGDVVLIRTGRWARVKALGDWNAGVQGFAGLHASVGPWLKARDIAMLGSDGVHDVLPSGVPGFDFPVHLMALNAMGMPLLDNLDLEGVAEKAARYKRWQFMFTAAPLRIEGGSGAPINATATF